LKNARNLSEETTRKVKHPNNIKYLTEISSTQFSMLPFFESC